jgi:hypothetical protein
MITSQPDDQHATSRRVESPSSVHVLIRAATECHRLCRRCCVEGTEKEFAARVEALLAQHRSKYAFLGGVRSAGLVPG